MELKKFEVSDLFGSLNHVVNFPTTTRAVQRPAVVIIHGRNGVGKTTLLRMLDGIIRLDFKTFRNIPFTDAKLTFDNGKIIKVVAKKIGGILQSIQVTYNKIEASLNPTQSGPLTESDEISVAKFRESFFADTIGIAFEYIDIERLNRRELSP
ncbi:ATP-binding cassette domain-containing protein [Mesorhizobium sp. M00.F.Ca.ET.186.01.1.1]|nr:ATP-binding cassette domain-containing protein [bacterium M00.F.Ca.ET.205.01.1.1]TGU55271.1 ATP-binding cassette domain-containing protein [bacterium M00.F.Ca.ET.152.01.1.1]TGV40436.1 ATP-binding cassette domain-containing protein [Mesorhizobium sp. M00.F.Ca.ET.186.01.1.1]TGZ45435.1 ATP-binding cassette domain-containing protein [bacterium M00.F.Ca.ET.162.01.1.1]TIW59998.1 MAG: ATP-binding cassette domain-containing protein [Mesorhizobium sp.]